MTEFDITVEGGGNNNLNGSSTFQQDYAEVEREVRKRYKVMTKQQMIQVFEELTNENLEQKRAVAFL